MWPLLGCYQNHKISSTGFSYFTLENKKNLQHSIYNYLIKCSFNKLFPIFISFLSMFQMIPDTVFSVLTAGYCSRSLVFTV